MIEILENRIAPAGFLTFTGPSGDIINITSSKGNDGQLSAAVVRDGSGNISAINLSSVFEGANFTVTDTIPAHVHGAGSVPIPTFNATGVDLGIVSIQGDVGAGNIGSNTPGTPAVKSFTVRSLGSENTSLGNLIFSGVVPTFNDLTFVGNKTQVDFTGAPLAGNLLGTATIGGSIVGGPISGGGVILVEGSAAGITVKGSIYGGSVINSGNIQITASSTSTPTKITVGSLYGGTGDFSGSIRATSPLGAINVLDTVAGGAGVLSGSIVSTGNIASVTVGHSISGNEKGTSEIAAGGTLSAATIDQTTGNLGPVTVHGSVGGSGFYLIEAGGNLKSIYVAGDVNGAQFEAAGNLGTVYIGGDSLGSDIVSDGTGTGLAIASVVIHGSATATAIASGQMVASTQSNNVNATLGSVAIYGQATGVEIAGGDNTGSSSKINSILIGGISSQVNVVSDWIVSIHADGAAFPLTHGAGNDIGTYLGVTYLE